MLKKLISIVGTRNDRILRRYRRTVAEVNAFEAELEPISDEALRGKTQEFRDRFANGETLDDLLPEAFAVVREAGKRVLEMRHFYFFLLVGMAFGGRALNTNLNKLDKRWVFLFLTSHIIKSFLARIVRLTWA